MKKALIGVSVLLVASLTLNAVLFVQNGRNAALAEEYRLSPPTNMGTSLTSVASSGKDLLPSRAEAEAEAYRQVSEGLAKALSEAAEATKKASDESRALREQISQLRDSASSADEKKRAAELYKALVEKTAEADMINAELRERVEAMQEKVKEMASRLE